MAVGGLILLGYLAGSIPFGVLVARWFKGVDVRSQGSGNIGATNVARVAGKKWGVLVLVLDALKGALPVLAAVRVLPTEPRVHVAVGLAAFLGHVFPVWLKLRGGKGVATALGVLGVLVPWGALAGAGVYVVLFAIFRVSSVGSLFGGLATVVASFFVYGASPEAALAAVLFILMVGTHRANIRRLVQRAEKRL